MVSTTDSIATQVGVEVLKNGGNAVDAACAAALAIGVTEGFSSGIGGGCFIVIHMADGRETAVDGRETAPKKSSRLMYVPKDTTKPSNLSTTGVLAAGTPGELAALEAAVRQYGRLPFEELVERAAAIADTGFILDDQYERALDRYTDKLSQFEGSRAVYFHEDGTPLKRGERLLQKDLAATLRRVCQEGLDGYYRGEVPRLIGQYVRGNGGVLSAADFENYKPLMREPVRGSYRGYNVISMPPPSSGGIHVIQILNLLEPYDLSYFGPGSSETIHLTTEAMQIAFADRAEFLGDPAFTEVPVQGLISKEYAAEWRSLISSVQHAELAGAGRPQDFSGTAEQHPDEKHTTHISVADGEGNAVALTTTLNTPFGSGVIVPGTGVLLNNQMDDFVTWPGRPNYFGLVGNAANEIEPGKRPLSSMAPTILLKDSQPYLVIGSYGGPRIITSTVLSIINVLDFDLPLQAAVDYPRWHHQWVPDRLFLEPDHPFDVQMGLRQRGHRIEVQSRWAGVTAVMSDEERGGWRGAADSRTTGLAAGF